jgi:hypothetical protein
MHKNTITSQTNHKRVRELKEVLIPMNLGRHRKMFFLEDAMFYGKSKKIIVIKDIHSNLFEEAILVLKEDKEQEREKGKKLNSDKIDNIKNDFILKEAELIINNYIKDNKGKFIPPKKKEIIKKSNFMKNLIINSALLGSVVAVVFLLIKLF